MAMKNIEKGSLVFQTPSLSLKLSPPDFFLESRTPRTFGLALLLVMLVVAPPSGGPR
jgi:hypothetical protein